MILDLCSHVSRAYQYVWIPVAARRQKQYVNSSEHSIINAHILKLRRLFWRNRYFSVFLNDADVILSLLFWVSC